MGIYTVILEFDGASYVRQIAGDSPASAILTWARASETRNILGLAAPAANAGPEGGRDGGPAGQGAAPAADAGAGFFLDEPGAAPEPLEGLANAWCASKSLRGKLALVTIVRTVEARQ